MTTYTTKDISKVLKIKTGTISRYVKTKVLTPSIFTAQTTGHSHLFSIDDLAYLFLLRSLIDLGVKIKNIDEALLRGVFKHKARPIIVHSFGIDVVFDPHSIMYKVSELFWFTYKYLPETENIPIEITTGDNT